MSEEFTPTAPQDHKSHSLSEDQSNQRLPPYQPSMAGGPSPQWSQQGAYPPGPQPPFQPGYMPPPYGGPFPPGYQPGPAWQAVPKGSRPRPRGVTILAIIVGILGSLGVALALLLITMVEYQMSHLDSLTLALEGSLLTQALILAVFVLILALAQIVCAWGLWKLKPWAFMTTVVVETLYVLQGLFSLLAGQMNIGTILFSLLFPLAIIVYLFAGRNVRAAFRT